MQSKATPTRNKCVIIKKAIVPVKENIPMSMREEFKRTKGETFKSLDQESAEAVAAMKLKKAGFVIDAASKKIKSKGKPIGLKMRRYLDCLKKHGYRVV